MKKKGFTLVELLAVIAILAVLVLIALPNMIELFNESKKNSFENEVKSVFKTAEEQWISDNTLSSDYKIYSKCEDGCDNPLKLSGRKNIEYYIKVNNGGKVVEYAITDGTYQYSYKGDGLNIAEIGGIESVSSLEENAVVSIESIGANGGVFSSVDNSSFRYTVTNNKATITGIDALEILDEQKCVDYLNKNVAPDCASFTSLCNSSDVHASTCSGSPQSFLIRKVPKSDYSLAGLRVKNIENLTIPSEIDGYQVTTVKGFSGLNLESVVISNGIKTIEVSAFCNNKLKSISIPDSVTSIGRDAFQNNRLPNDQAFIYKRTDSNNDGIAEISNTIVIGYGGAEKNVTIPNNVVTISAYAFNSNGLTGVTIPSSVKTIGSSAFAYNKITSVTIPNSVTSIGSSAFRDNEITSVTLPNNIRTLSELLFYQNKITSVTIPNSVTSIGKSAFELNKLTSITIPNNVTSLGASVFFRNQLTTVTIPSSVTSINQFAFGNNQLESVTINGKLSSSEFSTYGNALWGWKSDITCTKNNTSNVENGCITWNGN